MELLFAVVVILSLVLAAAMSVVAWRLLRDGHDRSAARVAALSSLADAEPDDVDEGLADDWDLSIRPSRSEDRFPRHEPGRRRPDRPRAAVPDNMFGTATTARGTSGGQGLAAVLTAAVIVILGAGLLYAMRSADSVTEFARRLTGPNLGTVEPLELLSLRHVADPTGPFVVTGLVQNPVEGSSLADIVAVVYVFDEEGRYFASGRAALDLSRFRPGDESPFVVTIPNAGAVSRYRVGFRLDTGGVVAHVDRRGTLPSGTTGDAVNGMDRGLERQPPAPQRVEG